MFEKVKRFAKKIATSKKTQMTCLMMVCGVTALMAQTTAGDYSAGTAALTQVSEEIAKYVPIVVKLCYAIAGVVAVVGAISVYIAMNNEEQDVKKKIMMVVGACSSLRGSPGTSSVLRTLLNRRYHERERGTLSGLSIGQGAATSP